MSLHHDALTHLSAWSAYDDAQEALRARFVEHLERRPDGTQRGCFPDHLTAGVLVLDDSLGHVLLNLHGKAKRWFHFGGHCEDDDPTLAGVALREGLEESGLPGLRLDAEPAQLDAHTVAFCDPRGTVHHLDVRYVALAPVDGAHATSEESLDVRWWPLDALPELEPAMHELIAIARRRFG
ncbi:NUDIX hydrolase [Nocardioides sp.]|uniref:NUDIX hydrolase n=1 Tax=Nocardioides sp. TaxID=35761 RepID=UPI0035695684